jgi:21S rRNA (GM2251-2'-O)-methyltransferase
VARVRGVASMPRFLRAAAADGWRVVGAALAPSAVRTRDLPRGPPTLLVLGSEGRGLRPMVQESCDVLLRIDGRTERAADDPVDSLNVSVAGAIALHHLVSF